MNIPDLAGKAFSKPKYYSIALLLLQNQNEVNCMQQPIKIDIISGFLGTGKTTLINKLLKEAYFGEKIAVLENEFGAVGVDGALIERDDINITEMSGGCICCSLKGTLTAGLVTIGREYAPDRIIIEPTGLADLTDIANPIHDAAKECPMEIDRVITVINGKNFIMQMEAGLGMIREQILHTDLALISRVQSCDTKEVIRRIHEIREDLTVVSADWDKINGLTILDLADRVGEHHIADEEGNCSCGCCHGEHDHDHHHHHHHHHHHSADAYSYFSMETQCFFTEEAVGALEAEFLGEKGGKIYRAKGVLCGGWRFDYVDGEFQIAPFSDVEVGKCVFIGKELKEDYLQALMEN